MLRKKLLILILLVLCVPVFVYGDDPLISSGDDVIQILANITTWLWRVFMIATVIAFLIAGFLYLTAAGNPDRQERANKMILYGVIGVVVALLSGGMVALIQSFLET